MLKHEGFVEQKHNTQKLEHALLWTCKQDATTDAKFHPAFVT